MSAIQDCPQPENTTQLQSFLGMVNYHQRFIPGLSSLLQPLTALLKKGTKWGWTEQCERAFQSVKNRLTTAPVLSYYDTSLPLRVAADASSYGVHHPMGLELP